MYFERNSVNQFIVEVKSKTSALILGFPEGIRKRKCNKVGNFPLRERYLALLLKECEFKSLFYNRLTMYWSKSLLTEQLKVSSNSKLSTFNVPVA